jgi:hypothetical protein
LDVRETPWLSDVLFVLAEFPCSDAAISSSSVREQRMRTNEEELGGEQGRWGQHATWRDKEEKPSPRLSNPNK